MNNRCLIAAVLALAVTAASAGPANIQVAKNALKAYQASGDYARELEAVGAKARAYLDSHIAGTAKPAIVLDIDETSLSNWEQIAADDFAYLPGWSCQVSPSSLGVCSALAWDALERAPAIAPTRALFDDAKAKGVAIFFITGRTEAERDVTEGNLRKAGYAGWTRLVMRPDGTSTKSAADFKAPERRKIEAEGYHIVISVGDQKSDLAGGAAEKTFKLPNPFYFIP